MQSKLSTIGIEKKEYPLLVALALFGMDFMLQGITVFILYGLYYLFTKRSLSFKSSLCVLLFSLFFFVFYVISSTVDYGIIKTIVALPLAFLIGYNIDKCCSEKICFYIIFVAFFMAFHAILNMIFNFSQVGILALGMRESYDIWTRDISASTGQATKLTPFIACVFFLLFYNRNKSLKYISIVLLFCTIAYDLELGGRSAFVLLFLSFFLSFILGAIRSKNLRLSARYLIVLLCLVGVFLWVYKANLFGIQDLFKTSSFSQRFNADLGGQDINEDDRTRRKLIYLNHLLDYPIGGQHLCNDLKIGHAHDLWLDTFDMAGLVPLFFLLCYTCSSAMRAFRIYKSQHVNSYIATLILNFDIIMNIQFYLEPIIEGSPKLFILYCMVDGMISQDLYKFDRMKKNTINILAQ